MHERLYTEFADWWPLLSPPEAHAERAALHSRVLLPSGTGSLLELGSAAGLLAPHLPEGVGVTLVDLSAAMLGVSEALNPGCAHVQADLRSLRLPDRFDAVLLHDAVMYMLSEADLAAAFATAFAHLRPGGRFLVVPDVYRDGFEETVLVGGGDGADGRAVQLMEWHWDPDPTDTTTRVEFSLLFRDPSGRVTPLHEQHTLGLFARDTYAELLQGAGFRILQPDWEDAAELGEVFLCERPNAEPAA